MAKLTAHHEEPRKRWGITREMERLKERAALPVLQEMEERERQQIIAQRKRLETREARLAERYRGEHARRVQWYWNVLDQLQGAPKPKTEAGRTKVEAALQEMKDAGLFEDGEEIAEWMVPTEAEIAEAEDLFAEYQREHPSQAPAQPEPAPMTPTSRVQPSESADPADSENIPSSRAGRRERERQDQAMAQAWNGSPDD